MWSDNTYITSFDAEANNIYTLATDAQKILWFNEGQSRLLRRKAKTYPITWAEGDTSIPLPADFVKMSKIIADNGTNLDPWKVWGNELVLEDSLGATRDGTGILYYWGAWTAMTTSTTATDLTETQDYACLYYALSRFYRHLASDRLFYKRYATLVGQNSVQPGDLQSEADRYYQDFLDTREDLEPDPPAFFYSE